MPVGSLKMHCLAWWGVAVETTLKIMYGLLDRYQPFTCIGCHTALRLHLGQVCALESACVQAAVLHPVLLIHAAAGYVHCQ